MITGVKLSDTDLSIIIPSFNTKTLLENCLESIFKETSGIPERKIEVIVVDNCSSDGTVQMIQNNYTDIRLIENSINLGFSKANNIGFAASTGRYVMYLNSDTKINDTSLAKILDFMDSNGKIDILGPKLLNSDGSIQYSAFKLPTLTNSIADDYYYFIKLKFLLSYGSQYIDYEKKIYNVGWLSGACIVITRKANELLSGWNETIFMYSEDTDLGIRANLSGLRLLYYPGASIYHYRGKSPHSIIKKKWMLHKNRHMLRMRIFRKDKYIIYNLLNTLACLLRFPFDVLKFLYRRQLKECLQLPPLYTKEITCNFICVVKCIRS